MAEPLDKETMAFLTRLGGATLSSLEDWALEYYWQLHPEMTGKFPYMRLHPNLPPCDDLIVGGLAVAPWVIGLLMEEDGKKKGDIKAQEMGKTIRQVGEGGIFYSGPMLLHKTLMTVPAPTAARARTRTSQSSTRRPAGIVYKL